MTLPEFCIKRPVFATVLSLVVLLVGTISYTRLAVREYPKIDEPVVSVTTIYRGASAEVVESQITKPLEDSLSGIEGVELMTSQSRSERSQINVRFRLTRDPDAAAADVRDKVARVRNRMPESADDSVIAKVEADAFPIVYIGGRVRQAAADRGHRLRQPLRQAPAVGAAGRGRRAGVRRTAHHHAHRDQPRAAGQLPPHRAGRRGRNPPPERRDSGGSHRVDGARVRGGGRDRPAVDRAVRQRHHRQRRRLSGAHPRRRQGAHRARRRTGDLALRRQAGDEHRRRQAVDRQSARIVQGGARGGRGDQREPAGRHEADHLLRLVALHRPLDQRGVPHHRRGHPAGGAGHLLLPAHAAGDVHSHRHDSRVADRRLCADVRVRLHRQYADAAGDGAGDRAGRRRRDRGAGEHLPAHGERNAADAGGAAGLAGDFVRGHRHDADAGVGVRAAGVRDRAHRDACSSNSR